MSEDFDDHMERQRQQARRRLHIAAGRRCAFPNCDVADPLCLTGSPDDLLCYEHRRIEQGATPLEYHHPKTRAIDSATTVPMLGNDHRVVTVMSKHWTDAVKAVRSGPMRRGLAGLFALRDVERRLVDEYADDAEELLKFVLWLEDRHPEVTQEFEPWRDSNERG